MPQPKLNDATALVRSAATLTESTFLGVGQALETSIALLSSLTDSFATVIGELNSDTLATALAELARAADQVGELGKARAGETARFERLERVADAIGARITQMNQSVKAVDSLAINSKIAAAGIRGAGDDFNVFANEIGRTLRMTRASLDSFGAELQSVRRYVATASAGQAASEKQQEEAVRSVPARIMATVEAIPRHHKRAAQAGGAVRERTASTGQRIQAAIMALQIGDITRQRLEHADSALALAHQQPALTDDERATLAAATCGLQAAQLADAAGAFERDVAEIAESLNGMAAEARALRELGSTAYGASDNDRETFIGQLEQQVNEALALFDRFGAARAEAIQIVITVAQATESLCGHLRKVQALEDDIRIMGLNTTFKCARIGDEGRALNVIAQELRAYANTFEKEADALMAEVEQLGTITASLTSRPDAGSLADQVARALRDSLGTFRQMGETLSDALAALDRDSARVEALLGETASSLAKPDGIGQAVRRAANDLDSLSRVSGGTAASVPPKVAQALSEMARSYTMAQEREVHQRVLGTVGGATKPAAAPAQAMEDMLF